MKLHAVLISGLITVTSISLLSGCALNAQTKENNPKANSAQSILASEPQQSSEAVPKKYTKLDSATMFEILAAEMMVQKRQMEPAFKVLYPLAVKTQDKALAERTFQISMATYRLENIEKATKLWRKVSPESATAWRASFILSLRDKQVPLAVDQWEKFHALSKADLFEDLTVSVNKVVATVPKEAGMAFFEALTKKYNQAWSSHYAFALAASVYKEPNLGLLALDKANQLKDSSEHKDNLEPKDDLKPSDNSEPRDAEALIYMLMSKLYLINGEPAKGINALEDYVNKNPQDLLLQERFARLQVQAKHYDEAVSRYKKIIKAEPKAYTSKLSLALIQLESENYDEAEKNLLNVAEQPGYASVGHYYLGVLYQDSNRFKLAKDAFSKVQSESYYVDAQLHLSEIAFAEDNTEKAYKILEAIPLDDKENKVKVLRAKAIFKSAEAKWDSAIDLYNQLLAIEPDNLGLLKAQSMLFYKKDNFVDYETNLLKVLKQDSNDIDVLNALGYFYVEQNVKLPQAYNLLQKALKLAPNSYYILDSMGWYYYQLGEYNQALEYLNKAFKVKADDEVLIHLITAYWQDNQINRAKSLWQNYHQDFLQNDRVQNLINELELNGNR
ncbi:tetratricopeptide repeat protein [Thiomicrorhabdus sp. Milos-T2]|uniref:tetratricopeptide repeat protein n=1 Tax=Thiomicrorhabdus sp. Milos-T2 TaxID=90814 RepID=UPI000494B2C5|nr:tetratricopeptide repeat protein [Thiomicrorhabdus sp. Milos-T2]